jgi:hypothetical protein
MQNKLSGKFGRRDIQFYDLYQHRLPSDEFSLLKTKNYPPQMPIDEIYGDIEVSDFNSLF